MDDSDEKPVAPGETASTRQFLTGKQWFAITMVVFGGTKSVRGN